MGGGVWVFRLASLLALGFVLSRVEASLGDIDPRYRTCVRECQTTGITGENIISHCQSKENDTSVGGSWYNQEQIYVQWKQLNCMTDCRYFCMMQREGERQSLGLSPVKYHGKWPFLRVSVFQEPLSAALSAMNLLMHFTGWLSFFLLVNYKLPLRPQTNRTYYEYTGLWHINAILSMNAWFWSSIFHTRDIDLTEKLDYSSAVALLGYSLILSLLRTFNVKDEATRVMFAAPILAFVTTHILYLNFYELDYGWNMKVCVVMAVAPVHKTEELSHREGGRPENSNSRVSKAQRVQSRRGTRGARLRTREREDRRRRMWCASCLASVCAGCTCNLCASAASAVSRRSARLAYCGLFAASLILSFLLRQFAAPLLKHIPWINAFDQTPPEEWFQMNAVLRVSLGNFLFFATFALMMIGVKDQNDRRDACHHGGWIAKIAIWAVLIVLMFCVPNIVITIYEVLSKFGSGFFLLVQVVMLLDFTNNWNDSWVEKEERKWEIALLVVTVVCYLSTFAFSGVLFMWFNPSGHDCGLNVFFIVMTLILAFAFAIVALHPQVNGSVMPASVISAYCAYLCYTSLSSEPDDYECNGLHRHSKQVSLSALVLGMLTTVLSVVYSAVRAGSSTTFLSPPSSPRSGAKNPLLGDEEDGKGDGKESEPRPVSYSYTFFHLIFALASMYSAMLLTGWTSAASESSELMDVGWTTVWVRICTEWVTAALYIWTLIAPLLFPDRDFS